MMSDQPHTLLVAPLRLTQSMGLRRERPSIVSMWRDKSCGTGVGGGPDAILTAHYELQERLHFYARLRAEKIDLLDNCCDVDFASATAHALRQTAPAALRDQIGKAAIEFVTGIELTTLREIDLPLVFVSLSRISKDSALLPVRDSSGSAIHNTPDGTLDAALLEFVERQCLIAAWLRGACGAVLTLDSPPCGISDALRGAIQLMMSRGRVHLLDVSLGWPVHTVLAVFEATRAGRVRFALGATAKFSPQDALAKALRELWQNYAHMEHLAGSDNVSMNRLEKNYFENNDAAVAARFGISRAQTVSVRWWTEKGTFTRDALLNQLSTISRNIGYYSRACPGDHRLLFCGKVVSPDFYLHIDIAKNLNTDNAFAHNLGLADYPTPLPVLPFS